MELPVLEEPAKMENALAVFQIAQENNAEEMAAAAVVNLDAQLDNIAVQQDNA
jgi:hypothetical protein